MQAFQVVKVIQIVFHFFSILRISGFPNFLVLFFFQPFIKSLKFDFVCRPFAFISRPFEFVCRPFEFVCRSNELVCRPCDFDYLNVGVLNVDLLNVDVMKLIRLEVCFLVLKVV